MASWAIMGMTFPVFMFLRGWVKPSCGRTIPSKSAYLFPKNLNGKTQSLSSKHIPTARVHGGTHLQNPQTPRSAHRCPSKPNFSRPAPTRGAKGVGDRSETSSRHLQRLRRCCRQRLARDVRVASETAAERPPKRARPSDPRTKLKVSSYRGRLVAESNVCVVF